MKYFANILNDYKLFIKLLVTNKMVLFSGLLFSFIYSFTSMLQNDPFYSNYSIVLINNITMLFIFAIYLTILFKINSVIGDNLDNFFAKFDEIKEKVKEINLSLFGKGLLINFGVSIGLVTIIFVISFFYSLILKLTHYNSGNIILLFGLYFILLPIIYFLPYILGKAYNSNGFIEALKIGLTPFSKDNIQHVFTIKYFFYSLAIIVILFILLSITFIVVFSSTFLVVWLFGTTVMTLPMIIIISIILTIINYFLLAINVVAYNRIYKDIKNS